jgi:hypothetical protein
VETGRANPANVSDAELDDSLHAPVIMARPVIIATASRPISTASQTMASPPGLQRVQRRGNWRTEHLTANTGWAG